MVLTGRVCRHYLPGVSFSLLLSMFVGWLTFTGSGSEFVMIITYVSVSVSSSARAARSTFVVPLERRWTSGSTAHGKLLLFNLFLKGDYRLHPEFLSVCWCMDLVYVILSGDTSSNLRRD